MDEHLERIRTFAKSIVSLCEGGRSVDTLDYIIGDAEEILEESQTLYAKIVEEEGL